MSFLGGARTVGPHKLIDASMACSQEYIWIADKFPGWMKARSCRASE